MSNSMRENVGDVGDATGVLRRTYAEIGVLADRSEVESYTFEDIFVSMRIRPLIRGDDEGGRGEVEYGCEGDQL